MGIEVAAIILGGISAASKIGQYSQQKSAAHAREAALDMEAEQQQIVYQQKTLSNIDAMQKVLQSQEAAMTTKGVSFASPSYNAAQRAVLNIGAKEQSNLDIEEDISELNIKREKENVKRSLHAQLFGDIADVAGQAFNFYSKVPTKSK